MSMRMEALLGVPVIPISAAKNEGVDELVRHALHIAKYQEQPLRQDFCDKKDHGWCSSPLYSCGDASDRGSCGSRQIFHCDFAATKAIEGDQLILKQLKLDENEMETLEHIVQQMETGAQA